MKKKKIVKKSKKKQKRVKKSKKKVVKKKSTKKVVKKKAVKKVSKKKVVKKVVKKKAVKKKVTKDTESDLKAIDKFLADYDKGVKPKKKVVKKKTKVDIEVFDKKNKEHVDAISDCITEIDDGSAYWLTDKKYKKIASNYIKKKLDGVKLSIYSPTGAFSKALKDHAENIINYFDRYERNQA